MDLVILTHWDLAMAAILVLTLAGLSWAGRLNLQRQLLVSALRALVQLLLIGLVLKTIFELNNPVWILLISLVMLAIAAHEVKARQHRRMAGWWGYGIGTLSMFLSSFAVMLITMAAIIQIDPWYHPQYLIPLLGMLLGNTMNGVAISLDRLLEDAWRERSSIEARLSLGHSASSAISDIKRKALRSGLIPIINAMATAGIVGLPGMMTGQILAGSPPLEATKYQVLILFLIAAGTGFGAIGAVWLASLRLFDERERLRLDRLISKS
ncbi:MAG: iron export ABC transporter permease subunit FetB [Gammaproteobacteria bacterium]|nr:MAG: iron export ABC transporter permease subunit FetB [Gammaproteobacteria bacterium]